MRYTRIQSYNIVSYFRQLEGVNQTLFENFLRMFIPKVLSWLEEIKDGLAEKSMC